MSVQPLPLGEALRALAVDELARAAADLAADGTGHGESESRTRKAIRRVRSVLDLAHYGLGRGGVDVCDELREVAKGLSDSQDGQALVEAFDALIPLWSVDSGRELLARSRHAACCRRDHLPRSVARSSAPDRLVALGAAVAVLPWQEVGDTVVERALARNLTRAAVAGERAARDDRESDWHRWRRRARRVWQQTRILDGIHAQDPALLAERQALAWHLANARHGALIAEYCGAHTPFDGDDRRELLLVLRAFVQQQRRAALDLLG